MLAALAAENLSTWSGLVGQVAAALSARKPLYAHVVVDESQDFGAAELKLVRALVPAATNDVLLCGDEGQRIYKPAFRWSALARWLAACEAAGIPLDQIAVLARSQKLLEERALPALAQRNLSAAALDEQVEADQRAVHVGTMHSAKRLEFRAVAVIACDHNKLPAAYLLKQAADPSDRAAIKERERNLLHVACTRARERLLVSWVGRPAQWLA